jgi:dTDP-4-amino-4,6-dideoxygalactose transaminase
MQAALGASQLQRIDQFVARRHELAKRYDEEFKGLPLTTPTEDAASYSGLHLYVVRLHTDDIKATHRAIFEGLRAGGIGVNLHYIPVYRQPYYARFGFNPQDFPQAERYYAEAISLPMYTTLTDAQQGEVVCQLGALLS